jgi:transcriptional regulator with XRE-family HTH domain
MKDRIIELLGSGISAVQVASACGVSESYVSQLLSDETISERVKALRVARASKYVEHDDHLDTDEEVARKLVRRNLDNGFLKPMEALKHFQVLNAARRKADSGSNVQIPTSTIVNISLPTSAAVHFKLTVDKQVVEVDGRAMTALPAAQVAGMLRRKKATELLEDHSKDADLQVPMKISTPALLDTI